MSKEKKKAGWTMGEILLFFLIVIIGTILFSIAPADQETHAQKVLRESKECFDSPESFRAFVRGEPSPC